MTSHPNGWYAPRYLSLRQYQALYPGPIAWPKARPWHRRLARAVDRWIRSMLHWT